MDFLRDSLRLGIQLVLLPQQSRLGADLLVRRLRAAADVDEHCRMGAPRRVGTCGP